MTTGEPRGAVLIVDDAPFMRRRLREILENGGYTVVAEGEDGDELLDLYRAHSPDVVTLDVEMARVTGLDALRQLRGVHPDARVVLCSSLDREDVLLAAVAAGARDYVLKPVDPAKLLDAVGKALR